MPDEMMRKLDDMMCLIRTAPSVPDTARSAVYGAVKAMLKEVDSALDTLISVNTATEPEEDD